jgi:thiol-disulfide isomerase/thioredoxin
MKQMLLAVSGLIIIASCNEQSKQPVQGPDSANSTTNTATISSATPVDTNKTAANAASATSALPAFRMRNGRGEIVDLAQFRGKKVFVNLWATWCPPCRAEIPSIESLGAKTDRNKVEFVMLSLDDNFDKAKTYAANNNMKLPVYYPAADLPQLFVTEGIPMTIIFNEKGEVVFNEVGSANYDTPKFQDLLK